MTSQKVEKYLADKIQSADEQVVEGFQRLEEYYVNKLWNQLSETTKLLVHSAEFVQNLDLLEFYENFIRDFEHRIPPLQLVELVTPIAQNLFKRDHAVAFDFLSKFGKAVENDKRAQVRLQSSQIALHLEDKLPGASSCQNMSLVREMIEQTQAKLDELVEVGPVHSAFYKCSAEYQRQMGDYARYYVEALRYLGCENMDNLGAEQRFNHAVLLSVAALLGTNVYNFGELLAHPILNALEGTPKKWLVEMLEALNSGDWDLFQKYKAQFETDYLDAKQNMAAVEQKLRLLCLMEMATKLPPKQRNLQFADIAKTARLPEDQVELLAMKAFANKLIEGHVDEVARVLNVSWVQPRVLSSAQIKELGHRMDAWCRDVGQLQSLVREHAKEVIV